MVRRVPSADRLFDALMNHGVLKDTIVAVIRESRPHGQRRISDASIRAALTKYGLDEQADEIVNEACGVEASAKAEAV